MKKRRIGAITFDLWDCLFIDDSDEPQRLAAGVPTKPVARRERVHQFLNRHALVSREAVDLAYNVTDAAFRKVWHDEHATWTVAERLGVLLEGLGRALPQNEFDELIKHHEEMELEFRPDPAPGAREALAALAVDYPLVVVSDAIFSPGRVLRELLAGEDMLKYFSHFVFSDELGAAKPAPEVFYAAAQAIGCDVKDLVHVGDRPHNDIGGPQTVGARAILLTAVKDRPLGDYLPDAVCDNYAKLPRLVREMDR